MKSIASYGIGVLACLMLSPANSVAADNGKAFSDLLKVGQFVLLVSADELSSEYRVRILTPAQKDELERWRTDYGVWRDGARERRQALNQELQAAQARGDEAEVNRLSAELSLVAGSCRAGLADDLRGSSIREVVEVGVDYVGFRRGENTTYYRLANLQSIRSGKFTLPEIERR